MINGQEGISGSGKSYEICVYHILPALEAGRMVITNFPIIPEAFAAINPDWIKLIDRRTRPSKILGSWDSDRVDENGKGEAYQLFDDGHEESPPAGAKLFSGVWDYYSTWKHPKTGQGPLFIIDEAHIPLPRIGCNEHVREWFSLHRHFNADVILATQRFRKIHPDISENVAMLVRLRKADILGRADHYIRKVHAGYPGGAVISTQERPYKKEYFQLYKSHTQGNSVLEAGATDVAPAIVKFRWFTRFWLALTAAYLAYIAWMWIYDEPKAKKVLSQTKTVQQGPPPGLTPQTVSAPPPAAAKPVSAPAASHAVPSGQQPVGEGEMPEPYLTKGLHLSGAMRMPGRGEVYTFTVSQNGVYVMTITDAELRKVGYKWEPLTDCAGALTWKKSVRAVICDAPRSVQITQAESTK